MGVFCMKPRPYTPWFSCIHQTFEPTLSITYRLSKICQNLESMMLHLHYIINFIFSMCVFYEIHCLSFLIVHPIMEKSDRRNTYQYKLRDSKLDVLNKLGHILIGDHRDVRTNSASRIHL